MPEYKKDYLYDLSITDDSSNISGETQTIIIQDGDSGQKYSVLSIYLGNCGQKFQDVDYEIPNLIWKRYDQYPILVDEPKVVYEQIGGSKTQSLNLNLQTSTKSLPEYGSYRFVMIGGGGGGAAWWRTHHGRHKEACGGSGATLIGNKTISQQNTVVVRKIGNGGCGGTHHGGEGGSPGAAVGSSGSSTIVTFGSLSSIAGGGSGGYAKQGTSSCGGSGSVSNGIGFSNVENTYSTSKHGRKFQLPKNFAFKYIEDCIQIIKSSLETNNKILPTSNSSTYGSSGKTYKKFISSYLKTFAKYVAYKKNTVLSEDDGFGKFTLYRWSKWGDVPSLYTNNMKLLDMFSSSTKIGKNKIWTQDSEKKWKCSLVSLYESGGVEAVYNKILKSVGITTTYGNGGGATKKTAYKGKVGYLRIEYLG